MFIQLDDGKTDEFAKSAGKGRFSSPTSAKNNNALHRHIFMPLMGTPESTELRCPTAIHLFQRNPARWIGRDRRFGGFWRARRDSNSRPSDSKSGFLRRQG